MANAAHDAEAARPLVSPRNQSSSTAGETRHSRGVQLALTASWVANGLLLVAKLVAFLISHSWAVLASFADSAVDLLSQVVITLVAHTMQRHSPHYPVGRSRLEALGVIACACIMSIASLEVVQFSGWDLIQGLQGHLPSLELGPLMYGILLSGTALKAVLWLYCRRFSADSDSIAALAEDHLNDVMSNSAAVATALIAGYWRDAWWVDPAGAILISVWIIARWIGIISEQVGKVVGRAAPLEFVARVEDMAHRHDARIIVDVTRAYHFGARFNVEMEIILPGHMTVFESHDIALSLQHKIEELPEVERALVHVDYAARDEPEHKVERSLLSAARNNGVPAISIPRNGGGGGSAVGSPQRNGGGVAGAGAAVGSQQAAAAGSTPGAAAGSPLCIDATASGSA